MWFCVGFLVFGLMGCCLFMVIDKCVCRGSVEGLVCVLNNLGVVLISYGFGCGIVEFSSGFICF